MQRDRFLEGALVLGALSLAACSGDNNSVSMAGSPSDAGQDTGSSPGVDASLPPDDGGLVADSGSALDADTAPGTTSTDRGPFDAGMTGAEGGSFDASDASALNYALFVGTDFEHAELSVVALHPDSVAGRLPLADEDSVPYASGGFGFVLEHTVGKAIVLDRTQPWTARNTIDVNDSPDAGSYASNPRAVVVTTGTKAYVARYASNLVQIVDVASGTVTGGVDLSAFVAPDDTDGLVDVQDGVYDPATGRAYFLLERINQFDFGPGPDFVGACLPSHGEIVAVNVATDAIVDANADAAAGTAINLLGDNPASLTPDFANGRIIVTETGCYQALSADAGADAGPAPRLGRGIESVALSTGTPTWLYQTSDLDRLSALVWVDGSHAFVNKGSDWFAWNPTQATLGSAVTGFPQAPFYDGAGRIVGLAASTPDAGSDAGVTWSVVGWTVATSQLSTLAASPFESVVPALGYGVASAFLH